MTSSWRVRTGPGSITDLRADAHNDVAVFLPPLPPKPPPCPAPGIDGPAAFLEASELGMKIQIASASQQQQPPSQPPSADVPERNGDAATLPEPKTDIQELLQKQGRPSCLLSRRGERKIAFYSTQMFEQHRNAKV